MKSPHLPSRMEDVKKKEKKEKKRKRSQEDEAPVPIKRKKESFKLKYIEPSKDACLPYVGKRFFDRL
jgi:hypothetical protein